VAVEKAPCIEKEGRSHFVFFEIFFVPAYLVMNLAALFVLAVCAAVLPCFDFSC